MGRRYDRATAVVSRECYAPEIAGPQRGADALDPAGLLTSRYLSEPQRRRRAVVITVADLEGELGAVTCFGQNMSVTRAVMPNVFPEPRAKVV